LNLVSVIAKLFEVYQSEDAGYVDVDVFVAYAFSKDDKPKFAATLEKTLGKKVNMKVTVDKSLIGGVLVHAGDRVIDGSIKGQLQTMQKTLQ
jgi:F-type H+-transporting ATPase subunit delta